MKYEGPLEGMSVRETTLYLCSLGSRRFALIWESYRRFAGFRVEKSLEEYKADAPPEQKDLACTIEAIVNAEKWYRRKSFDNKPWVSSGKAKRNTDNYMAMIKHQRAETITLIAEKELRDALKDINVTYDEKNFRRFKGRVKLDHQRTFIYYLKLFS